MNPYRIATAVALVVGIMPALGSDIIIRKPLPAMESATSPAKSISGREKSTVITEDTLVGENQQPQWTTQRRFPTTRIYVQQPPGNFGMEQWWRMDDSKGKNARHRFRTEFEYGLARRTQIDLYLDAEHKRDGDTVYHDTALELRYALADWGELPLNPTLYYEYKFVNESEGPDGHEIKLLVGDAFDRWHWGVNFIYEQQLGGAHETEYAVSQALGFTMRDRVWSIGEEFKFASVSEDGARGNPSMEYSTGPSIQFHPTPDSHLDLVALFGLSDDAPDIETYLVFGFDFGPVHSSTPLNPMSSRGR